MSEHSLNNDSEPWPARSATTRRKRSLPPPPSWWRRWGRARRPRRSRGPRASPKARSSPIFRTRTPCSASSSSTSRASSRRPCSATCRPAAPQRERARHIWNRFIDWGAANPARRKALRQLKVSDRIGADCRRLRREARSPASGRCSRRRSPAMSAMTQSVDYAGAVFGALAETTLDIHRAGARAPRSSPRARLRDLLEGDRAADFFATIMSD